MHHLFLDESGNHSLDAYEPSYPVFVLGGVLVGEHELACAIDKPLLVQRHGALAVDPYALSGVDVVPKDMIGSVGREEAVEPSTSALASCPSTCLQTPS